MYIKCDVMLFFISILLLKHSTLWIYDRKNVKFEWLINLSDYYNLLGPGTFVPAVKSNNFAPGMLQA